MSFSQSRKLMGESKESIAIVGMGCKFPNSKNPGEFWKQLNAEQDAITEIPQDRWSIDDHYSSDRTIPGKTYSRHGGFIEDIYDFDPLFFKLSKSEVKFMDPQQRLMLEISWQAFENACIVPSTLVNQSTGVFIAASTFDYASLSTHKLSNITYYSGIGTNLSIIANRLSYLYNLDGPSLTVDTACSSSLVALHLACQSLQTGESNLALVGGVNALLSPIPFIGFSKANVLDETGHCRSFDTESSGLVRGEGCGVVLLKRLSDAEKDNNQILAVIEGSAINQDGTSNGISAPNGLAQQKVIEASWKSASVTSADISFIEAHGTATPIGDPIELNSINSVLKNNTSKCYLGSAKASIGHLEAAAGIASLIKVILCLQNNTIPAQCNFNALNPNIRLNADIVQVADMAIEWSYENTGKRTAGINSFGFGGTNAHVVISEHVQKSTAYRDEVSEVNSLPQVILLSAKKKESLINMAKNLLRYINNNSAQLKLDSLARTLQSGREHFFARVAICASTPDALSEGLQAFIDSEDHELVISGKAKRKKSGDDKANIPVFNTLAQCLEVAKLWVSGEKIDWVSLNDETGSFLHDLPGYSFHKETIKFTTEDLYSHLTPIEKLHPLIHKNESSLHGLSFSTKLSGHEYFLKDHRIDGQLMLPGAAYLEIAKTLGELALKREVVCISNLIFIEPLTLPYATRGISFNVKNSNKKDQVFFNISSGDDAGDPSIFARGKFESVDKAALPPEDHVELSKLKQTLTKTIDKETFYDIYQNSPFQYGPTHRTVDSIWYDDEYILAMLRQHHVHDDFQVDIGLMDGVFQCAMAIQINLDNDKGHYVPFSVKKVTLYHQIPHAIYTKMKINLEKSTETKKIVDVWITDHSGQVMATLSELTFQRTGIN